MYTVIDLFCGAGGLTRGLVDTGIFKSVLGNDIDEDSIASFEANFGKHGHREDLNKLLKQGVFKSGMADLVVGGPPCQGFSLLNKQREGDERRGLWHAYYRVLEIVKPRAFVMENVPELFKSEEFTRFRTLAERELGFTTWARILNAADFGAPQRRRRAIAIGVCGAVPVAPMPTHYDPNKIGTLVGVQGMASWRTVRDAIGDLVPPEGTEIRSVPPPYNLHFGRNPTEKSLQRYRVVGEGENRFDLLRKARHLTPGCWIRKKTGGTDLFGRLWWDRPAFTIRTEFFKPEKGRYLHPQQHRPITHREAARLQTFPDCHIFIGSKTSIARQIGNAVPPRLASAIANAVAETLAGHKARRRVADRNARKGSAAASASI